MIIVSEEVRSRIPEKRLIVDVGCGPSLLLRDLQRRYLDRTLFAYDISDVTIGHARKPNL